MRYLLKLTSYTGQGEILLKPMAGPPEHEFMVAAQLTRSVKGLRVDVVYEDDPNKMRATFYSPDDRP